MTNKNALIPFWQPGDTLTGVTTAAVTGKRLVKISGARDAEGKIKVAHTDAAGYAFAVAGYDAASGKPVTLYRTGILPVKAGAAITAGQALKADANGQVIPQGGAGIIVGQAVDDAASGSDCPVDFRP